MIPDNLSYKVLEYNHHSLKGNIEAKKEILIKMASILESYSGKLNEINKTFKSEEQMIEIQAETYYRALRRIEDDKVLMSESRENESINGMKKFCFS